MFTYAIVDLIISGFAMWQRHIKHLVERSKFVDSTVNREKYADVESILSEEVKKSCLWKMTDDNYKNKTVKVQLLMYHVHQVHHVHAIQIRALFP